MKPAQWHVAGAAQIYWHPISKAEVFGLRLEAGATLQSGDVFDGMNGLWRLVPETSIGHRLGYQLITTWIRPIRRASRPAHVIGSL